MSEYQQPEQDEPLGISPYSGDAGMWQRKRGRRHSLPVSSQKIPWLSSGLRQMARGKIGSGSVGKIIGLDLLDDASDDDDEGKAAIGDGNR